MSLDRIVGSFRLGEIVDDAQIEELQRWQLLDFVSEPDDAYVSDCPIVTGCGGGRSGTMLTRAMLDSIQRQWPARAAPAAPIPVSAADLRSGSKATSVE